MTSKTDQRIRGTAQDYCPQCSKLVLRPNVAYGINPDAICTCAAAPAVEDAPRPTGLDGIMAGLKEADEKYGAGEHAPPRLRDTVQEMIASMKRQCANPMRSYSAGECVAVRTVEYWIDELDAALRASTPQPEGLVEVLEAKRGDVQNLLNLWDVDCHYTLSRFIEDLAALAHPQGED